MNNKQQIKDFTIEKIQIEYIHKLSQLFTFLIGGEITLLGTVFKDCNEKGWALISIFLMIVGIFFSYSIVEIIVRRISPKPKFNDRLMRTLVDKLPSSIETEWIRSVCAGICFFSSLVLYFIFVLKAMT